MRVLGWLLLIVGFAWICVQQFDGLGSKGRSVVLAQYARLPPSPTKVYSQAEVKSHIAETASAAFRLYPFVIFSGALMLIGGVLLARSGHEQKARNGA